MKLFSLFLFMTVGVFTGSRHYFKEEASITSVEIERINSRVGEIRNMMKIDHKYNNKIAFLVDMKVPSGKNRFFVYDLEKNEIIDQGLVAHGSGSETGINGMLKFSNEPNSNCTALGRYAIGKNYKGIFGKAYRLMGLDETNDNALKRAIVLHSYSAVPAEEQNYYISRSKGCPMVSEQFFKRIEKIIDSSKSNILLDIYY
ncbi:L,D-transpeptidase catalytic domain [Flavobacterium sp. CF108]|uniref:murein L,D-transpeptidase catalytic domain-containing protein n=1 Tax=unclassified Flavobacterium TaxID=196869 RepID=UPI0008D030F0|nr:MULTISPECIES: murein L,D-transpeptidase catalytic domain family protein [unclassified Flavobacterium]SEO29636.1 L,D-transpeptidase catalytic domain [Flavobacterium sp. fv08]SHG43195.1 L,D-transpeptidase catalytic domain [Flavobacterium sp. CF108]